MVKVRFKAFFGMLTAALVTAPSALAVGSAQSVYGGEAGVTHVQVQAANTAATASSSGSLPFTGLDLMLLVGGGMLLLLTGIALFLVSRPHASS
jgi:hypothetical protein